MTTTSDDIKSGTRYTFPLWPAETNSVSEFEIFDDTVSNFHVRIYAIDYETGDIADINPLVFAEVLSTNGTLLVRSADVADPGIPTSLTHLFRGDGAILLNHGDRLVVTPNDYFDFEAYKAEKVPIRNHRSLSRQNHDTEQFEHLYFVTKRLIGVGGTGKVYLAYHKKNNDQLACKVTRLDCSAPGKVLPLAALSGPLERLRYHVPEVEFLRDLVHVSSNLLRI